MSQNRNKSLYEGLITALAIGGFFIILGFVVISTPNVTERVGNFFSDLTIKTFSVGSSGSFGLPAPDHPAQHIAIFTAVMNFALGIGILQIVILALRVAFRSPLRRIAETIGNLIFWLGATVMANVFLLAGTVNGWFQFWATLIILAGASLIAQFFVYLAARARRHPI